MPEKETSFLGPSYRVALVCDWLTTVGGAESVLLTLHQMFPDAPIYTSKYDEKGIDWFKDADVRTGWLQHFPNFLRRFISPLRQHYFSHLDLSGYDLVISVTGAEAKSVYTASLAPHKKPNKSKKTEHASHTSAFTPVHRCVHICYCHVPTQYYWAMYDDYLKNPGFGILNPLARLGLKLLVKPLRKKDFAAAQRPDHIITISNYAAEQIAKYYGRESRIIYPPADLKKFSTKAQEFSTGKKINSDKSQVKKPLNYITTSRQVNWKRLDICIKAARRTGDNLTLIGDGPEHKKLVKLAKGADNIHFLPAMPQEQLKEYLKKADGFLFPSQEPFGLAPVEAMACGLPVIAFYRGGARDYIEPGKNGELFKHQSPDSLVEAMKRFNPSAYSKAEIIESVQHFDKSVFIQEFKELVNEVL